MPQNVHYNKPTQKISCNAFYGSVIDHIEEGAVLVHTYTVCCTCIRKQSSYKYA